MNKSSQPVYQVKMTLYEVYRQWGGGDFVPEKFELDAVNRGLRTLK